MTKLLATGLALLIALTCFGARADDPSVLSLGRLDDVLLLAPDGPPAALVAYISDRSGWTPRDSARVEALRRAGAVVLEIDLERYGARLDADTGECLYVVGEITDLAQAAQRRLGITDYLAPILVGAGEGATFAYAAVADAPPNTLGGAVAVGFDNRLSLRLPFCPGPTAVPLAGGGFGYGFDKPLQADVHLLVDPGEVAALRERTGGRARINVNALRGRAGDGQVVARALDLAAAGGAADALPAVDIPATGAPRALAIFLSGDGGWRDLDKTIGEWMSGRGIHVIGFDSLHYFWSKKDPAQLARDLSALAKDADPTGAAPVLLIGYSFGADTLPFAWPLLDADLRARVHLIGLLAPSRETSFQVTISGWLGIDASGYDIVPAIAKLPADLVLCVYGEDEAGNSCSDPALAAVTRIKTAGGHHFDGKYEALGQELLDAFDARAGTR